MAKNVKTYRARSMQEALALVRRELGPRAAVLHTREIRGGWLMRSRQIEVTASASVEVPSRLPPRRPAPTATSVAPAQPPAAPRPVHTADAASDLTARLANLRRDTGRDDQSAALFRLFTDLVDADLAEDIARELVERMRREATAGELADPTAAKERVAKIVEADIRAAGPIRVSAGRRTLVALVGPTGVGKTTTIAKLAANYRLREKRKVGLITVDTYRIAAVEQLRTYADIIDLPMEVVATPREMRHAVARLADQELVLLDTAGRSPHDEVRIQELKSLLGEAAPDEVHLVLSSCASASALAKTVESFTQVGATSLVLTKLDESSGLGNLLSLLRRSRLPVSYLTNGQNVPDDIEAADARRLSRLILALETSRG